MNALLQNFKWFNTLLLLAVSMSLTGCNAAIDIDKALESHLKGPAKIYRHSLNGAPSSLDPVNAATIYTNHIVVNIYDTLYRYK